MENLSKLEKDILAIAEKFVEEINKHGGNYTIETEKHGNGPFYLGVMDMDKEEKSQFYDGLSLWDMFLTYSDRETDFREYMKKNLKQFSSL